MSALRRITFNLLLLLIFALPVRAQFAPPAVVPRGPGGPVVPAPVITGGAPIPRWQTFINATDLYVRFPDRNLLIIDVREATAFAQGHIPEAINIPSALWREPPTIPGEGPSNQIFRKDDGTLDVAQYEKLFSEWGIRNDHRIVVYGNDGGKPDGSIPVGILQMLGHQHVAFLDGIGTDQWLQAGHTLTFALPKPLAPSHYSARARTHPIWNLQDVLDNVRVKDVVFLDLRTEGEFTGRAQRSNKHGGHIPGAKNLNVDTLRDRVNRTTLSPDKVWPRIVELGLPTDKDSTIVVYGQTGTRAIYGAIILRDLGFNNVAIYDNGWQEYGNRDDTVIETASTPPTTRPN